ncbi:TetR/AcrR family transcriptional regulator C-terminal domain-containing protein [Sphaerisporangium sp. NPDC088356]|uniref:TetR/AcrR family transcriptional regulator C-terminal domain-containing protein n=1 Tax=Sphaerisporangium sp. NPDC088356 TaxID=3154871 RepID=UPI00342B1397
MPRASPCPTSPGRRRYPTRTPSWTSWSSASDPRLRGHSQSDWRRTLRDFAVSRRELLRHPGVLQLVATRPVTTPDAIRMLEAIVTMLRDAGFGLREAFHLMNTVAMFTTGHCLAEVDPPGEPPMTIPEMDPAEFPNATAAIQDGLGTPEDHQARYDFAIDALSRGFSSTRTPEQG